MSWVRDYAADNGSYDGQPSGGGSLTIDYIVTGGYSAAQILRNPTAILGGITGGEPLPGYGSEHPEFAGFYLDRYDPQSLGVVTRLRATYSRNGSGRIPARPAPPEIGDFKFQTDYEEIITRIPYQIRTLEFVANPPGFAGPPDPVAPDGYSSLLAWRVQSPDGEKYILREGQTVSRYSTKAVISEENYLAASEAIRRNNNKINNINGRLYQFVAGSVVPRSGLDGYETTLTWWADDGYDLADEFYSGSPPNVMYPPRTIGVLPFVGAAVTRPPFHAIDLIPPEDADPTVPSTFIVRPIGQLRSNGHLELVGYVEGWN